MCAEICSHCLILFLCLQAYQAVNLEFAEKTVNALRRLIETEEENAGTPLVWLHDYHLMLAANTIRNVSLTFIKLEMHSL